MALRHRSLCGLGAGVALAAMHLPLGRVSKRIVQGRQTADHADRYSPCAPFAAPWSARRSEAIGRITFAPPMRLVIADNDDTDSAREVVAQAAQTAPFPCHYIHAPARNISLARNACLDAATARQGLIVSLDDDETVMPTGWSS